MIYLISMWFRVPLLISRSSDPVSSAFMLTEKKLSAQELNANNSIMQDAITHGVVEPTRKT